MKKQIISITLVTMLTLSGCGTQNDQEQYDNTPILPSETTAIEFNYTCAADLLGEPIVDIKASGFDFDTIYNLTEYDPDTAKPYTILMDGTYAFAAGVLCKGNAVIINGLETAPTLDSFDPPIDLTTNLWWSAAENSYYCPRIISANDRDDFNVNYFYPPQDPTDIFAVNPTVPSKFAFVYRDSYIYLPDYDFMWFNWGDNIYNVQSALIDKGFNIEESLYVSNNLTTKSVSEKLYGHDFYIYLSYNDNMQFTKGTYSISGEYYELADIAESAIKDIVAKYGDSYKLNLTTKFTSLDAMLDYMRSEDKIDPYQFNAEVKWNVKDHTAISLNIYSTAIEIEYKSISATGGTGMSEDSLI